MRYSTNLKKKEMKRNRILLVAVLLFLSGSISAQEAGFFGKKTFIEIGGQGQLPLLLNAANQEKGYVVKSGTFNKSYNLKDFSFRAGIGTILSENTAVAIEYNHHFYQVNPLRGGELNRQYLDSSGTFIEQYIRPEVAFLQIQERTIMPKIIFSSNAGRVPAGLTQEIGLGYCLIAIMNREAEASSISANGLDGATISKSLIDPEVEEYKGMTFMYGLRMNFPVTRNFLVNVGVRYNYSWLFNKKGYRKTEMTESWLSGRELWSRLQQRRQLGIITFGVGGVFCF